MWLNNIETHKYQKLDKLQNGIISILKKETNKTFNYKQIASILGLNDASSRNQIIKKLQQLKANNDIEEIDRGKFKAILNTEYHTGILDLTSKGSGYVLFCQINNSYVPIIGLFWRFSPSK